VNPNLAIGAVFALAGFVLSLTALRTRGPARNRRLHLAAAAAYLVGVVFIVVSLV
jgi:hypothetical protein